MQVIADRAARAVRKHGAHLVHQRLGLLVAADLAPMGVELAGHAEERNAERIDIAGAQREMLVAPAGGRQALKFEVGVIVGIVLAQAAPHVARVEEQRHFRIVLLHGIADAGEVVLDRLRGENVAVARVRPVEPERLHLGLGRRRDGRQLERDVHEDAVGIGIVDHHLLGLRHEVVEIGRRVVEEGPACAIAGFRPEHRQRAVRRNRPPLRVLEGGKLIPGGGEVDRGIDAHGMQRIDLRAEQVERQMRMHLSDLGRMIAHAVMALGKHRDAVDIGVLEGLAEGLGVEARADAGDRGVGVEIEMDLAETHKSSLVF